MLEDVQTDLEHKKKSDVKKHPEVFSFILKRIKNQRVIAESSEPASIFSFQL